MILDKKMEMNCGSIRFKFWIDGWRKKEEIINEVAKEIHPFKILSSSCKYIYGITGKETEVHLFAITINEIIVGEKENKEAIYV